jgi:hypothetical protein
VETLGQDELAGASCGNPPVSAQSLQQKFDQVRRDGSITTPSPTITGGDLEFVPRRSFQAAPSTGKENRFPIHEDHDVPCSVARQD